jgi:hypothetical protein
MFLAFSAGLVGRVSYIADREEFLRKAKRRLGRLKGDSDGER